MLHKIPFLFETQINEFLYRTILDLIVIFIISRLIYYPNHKNKEFLFTFNIFNITIFLLCFLLISAKIELGFAFGLFAIFSIIRYRTVTVPIREMGYFFFCVAIGVINGLMPIDHFGNLFFINFFLVTLIYFLDRRVSLKHENFKIITYDKVDLLQNNDHDLLLQEINNRTGFNFHRIEILRIDFFKEIVRVKAFYYSDKAEGIGESGDDE